MYSEARNEYLKQMASWLSSPIVEFFRGEYQKISVRDPAKAMSSFQTWCADVPKWNQDVIDTNVSIVLDTCRCDYVEELMRKLTSAGYGLPPDRSHLAQSFSAAESPRP